MAVDESKQKGAYWLTGSQQFQLMKGVSESLAGRIAIINLLGFSLSEYHQAQFSSTPFIPGVSSVSPQSQIVNVLDLYNEMLYGFFPAIVDNDGFNRDMFYS